jgi:hypothetical protein
VWQYVCVFFSVITLAVMFLPIRGARKEAHRVKQTDKTSSSILLEDRDALIMVCFSVFQAGELVTAMAPYQ